MITRTITTELLKLANSYPVVTIIGPRQSGKTTLARQAFPDLAYYNLESLDKRELAISDPRSFLSQFSKGAILDEIQRAPQLLSYIQEMVDNTDKKGMFVLTGSHQLELHHAITQSLAGRTAILKLLPLSLVELNGANFNFSVDEYLLYGGLPGIYKNELDPTRAYRNYLQTYIERDVRMLINLKDLDLFQKFLKLCASRVGQILNVHSISNDLGISSHTISNWLSVLEASFIIFRLQPYFENFGKRLIKSPKLYFTDVGIATYLLDIENVAQIARDPLRGNLVENLVILELLKTRLNQGLDPHMYFYRDNLGHEVDVIYKKGNELVPIEIKAARTFNSEFLKGLHFVKKLVDDRCKQGFVIYTGDLEQQIGYVTLLNYLHSNTVFAENV